MGDGSSAFADLRRLAEWFATSPTRGSLHVEKIVERLGATCVPLLGRELCSAASTRRDAARAALAQLATQPARTRVIAELRCIADSDARDEGKVAALGLLAELGERAAARFHDPSAIQRSSALALAEHLDEPADVAAAADMMIRTLHGHGNDDGIVSLLAVMADTVPAGAHRLATELCARLDVAPELRERIADVAPAGGSPTVGDRDSTRRSPRPTLVTVLVDGAAAPNQPARTVVVASRKHNGARRWRRWAVLIAASGAIEDCIHEADATVEADTLVDNLVADGYRVTTTDLEAAKLLVATAARRAPEQLPNAYYVGRDLLELADAHLSHARRHASNALGRAIELIADDDLPRARLLLARCDGEVDVAAADVAAAHAAIAMAHGRHAEAATQLARAVDAEPGWPLHHWNLACVVHQLGDAASCYAALRRFLATSEAPSGLAADPDQPGRIAHATRLCADLERSARLTGTRLDRPRRKRRSVKAK